MFIFTIGDIAAAVLISVVFLVVIIEAIQTSRSKGTSE